MLVSPTWEAPYLGGGPSTSARMSVCESVKINGNGTLFASSIGKGLTPSIRLGVSQSNLVPMGGTLLENGKVFKYFLYRYLPDESRFLAGGLPFPKIASGRQN